MSSGWGGEEFIVLLPETGVSQACALAERIRNAIAELHVHCGNAGLNVTASFGVAEREPQPDGLSTQAIRRAITRSGATPILLSQGARRAGLSRPVTGQHDADRL